MRLRAKLLIATTATAVTVLGISEWVSYQQTIGFLMDHVSQMERSSGVGNAAQFGRRVDVFADRLILTHVLHAVAEVAALLLLLNVFWSRLVLRPVRRLLYRINLMWDPGCNSNVMGRPMTDELRMMDLGVGQLGDRLTSALRDAKAATELSTLAQLGKAAVRKVEVARDQLAGALTAIAAAERRGEKAPENAIRSMESVLQRLESVSRDFAIPATPQVDDGPTNSRGGREAPILTVR